MINKSVITTLVFVNLLPLIMASFCDLKLMNPEWLDDWHLILTENEKEEYQFLREGNVKDSANLSMLCRSEPPITAVMCKKGIFNVTLPLPLAKKCKDINRIQQSKIVGKAKHCPYDLHKIGFNVEIGGKTQFLETYQVCFDKKHMRPVFTINTAYPIADGRPETLQFHPDDMFYGNTFHSFDRSSLFQRFKKLLGNAQTYMSSSNLDHIIDRGHLTPSADFITTTLKKSTFSMINVIPQFKTINNGNWRLIEQWARDKSRTPAKICTGVLDCNLNSDLLTDLYCILQLKTKDDKKVKKGRRVEEKIMPMFLADDHKIPIPLWSYKIVTSKTNDHTVFLTYNNIYHQGQIQPPSNVCAVENCPLKIKLKFVQTIKNGRTFCCNYVKFLDTAVPHLKGTC